MNLSADDVGAVLARQPLNKGKSPEQLRDYWVASKTFRLQEVPLNAIGTATEIEPGARSRTKAPIIVDLNQNQVGRLRDAEGRTYGAPPDALVLDGKHRVAEALGRGDATIMAYVGDRVAGLLKKAMQQHQAMKSKIEDLTERYLASDTPGGVLRELRQLLPADDVERLRKRWKELHRSSATTAYESVTMKRAIIAELLRARRPRLANAVAIWVAAKLMPVQEALNWLDMDAEKLGDPAVLKKAYRDASMKHHPDRGGTKEAMQKVNEAYEVLRKQKGGSGFTSPADRAEQELKVDQAATIMEQGLRTAFNEQKFTDHIEKATGKKFNATSKITRDKTYYGYTIRLFAEWKSEDGLTTFELRAWADAERFNWGPRQLGAGGQDYSFQISAYSRIFHETRKVKFKQSDWAASSDSRVVLDPKSMFPAPKIKAMMGGKEKRRKFSRRDMLLGLEKLLGAKTWGSGKDTYVNVPLGKDGKFTLQMARSTMMGQAMWIPTGRASISEGNPGLRSTVQHPIGSFQDVPEFEGSLLALKDLQKKTANMEDGKQVAEAVKRMLQQLRNDWQAGKLG